MESYLLISNHPTHCKSWTHERLIQGTTRSDHCHYRSVVECGRCHRLCSLHVHLRAARASVADPTASRSSLGTCSVRWSRFPPGPFRNGLATDAHLDKNQTSIHRQSRSARAIETALPTDILYSPPPCTFLLRILSVGFVIDLLPLSASDVVQRYAVCGLFYVRANSHLLGIDCIGSVAQTVANEWSSPVHRWFVPFIRGSSALCLFSKSQGDDFRR